MDIHQAIDMLGGAGPGASSAPSRWADLGCGSGLFTFALADFLAAESTVYAIDVKNTLSSTTTANKVRIIPMVLDFATKAIPEYDLDGILMANSIHYVQDKRGLLRKLSGNLRAGASFIIVEYDTDIPTPVWVPYPLSFGSLKTLFADLTHSSIEKLSERPSIFGNRMMYAAIVRL